ncbi:hypothetical protein TREES_T100006379 [Tupaia chinensis]|uniref:Uncharacterized protein n=1 Tax=Tupaia chinensis TaxID=246437 RepID=L9KYF2_TUPCH|nr:hypothetical protein TREES_T100006379 [Tupaia chinensis]
MEQDLSAHEALTEGPVLVLPTVDHDWCSCSICLPLPMPADVACLGVGLASIHTANKETDAKVDHFLFYLIACIALLSIRTRDSAPVWSLVA